MTSRGIVLSLCDLTTKMLLPWAQAGYRCVAVDLQHTEGNQVGEDGIERVGVDLLAYLPPRGDYAACFAFPPCTHLASSGARWFGDKGLGALHQAIRLVDRARGICEWTGAPYCIENPVGTLSTYWRKPDYTFDPCDYGGYLPDGGDAYTKKTCLWTGGGFVMPSKRRVPPVEGSKMHRLPPSAERANLRSETPMGFARAVFEANAPQATAETSK